MNEYREALRQYANFTGRATRRDYWMFFLFNFIFSTAAGILDRILGLGYHGSGGPIAGLYGLALLIPSLAVATRRLHDTDRSGWWLLMGFLPIIGWIVLLVFLVQAGHPGANRYGTAPIASGYPPYGGAPYGGAPTGVPYGSPAPYGAPPAGAPYGGAPGAPGPVPPVASAPPAPPVPQVKVDGWQPDPTGRHELRYKTGDVWTEHVSDKGVTSVDPI